MKDVIQFHRNGNQIDINSLPWMLTEQQRNVVKQVMRKIKFHTGFCANMKNIITNKGDFVGVKTHDCNIFIKVNIIMFVCVCVCVVDIIILLYCYIFYSSAYCCYFLSTFCKK